ncbi:hypothetical protein BCR41DRAFT_348583 [Lobosporangium transversale]|uniref:Uncharacterized protein n=1 Tax=Lobosporangium transversale TaxID=64571 RepID=A0A1Y2GUQ3_9FUNG|nr:hypothetical protein BCR41DRAFT_348583 [Lobosporangium transversale]ORZ24820.1 hypothetical protein BCR41DRAFT_348583 [Lobosporangium transversale]|eukprot:XP_021883801.1 hypothetical protein BCR41DRAFT_348583 [Lobosporangium transversale]
MSSLDDDRKQRFRFHKQDEILLLQIVLRAKPCPYKISSRDGAILVAWNHIAEEFERESVPRPDGKLPHPRTCRTRCDKMIMDFMAMRATPHLRGKKQESEEDRLKNELLEKLASIQGKVMDSEITPSASSSTTATTTAITGTVAGDVDITSGPSSTAASAGGLNTTGAGAGPGPGPGTIIPGHILGSSAPSTATATHQQRASVASTTSLMPQSLNSLGNNSHHRVGHGQSTSELLAASGLMLSSAVPGSSNSLSNNNDGNNSNNPSNNNNNSSSSGNNNNNTSDIHSRVDRSNNNLSLISSSVNPANSSAPTSRKRAAGSNAPGVAAALTTTTSTTTTTAPNSSLDYLQRMAPPASSSSSSATVGGITARGNQQSHSGILPAGTSKRLRSTPNERRVGTTAVATGNNSQHRTTNNYTRSALGTMSNGLGSSLLGTAGQSLVDLTGISSSTAAAAAFAQELEDDNNEWDDDSGAGQHNVSGEGLGNEYDNSFGDGHDLGDEVDEEEDSLDPSSLMSSSLSHNVAVRTGRRGPGIGGMGGIGGVGGVGPSTSWAARSKVRPFRFKRTPSTQSLQRHPSGSLGKFELSLVGEHGGYLLPSQMTEEDREFTMRMIALEECKVKIQLSKLELTRRWLELESKQLEHDLANAQEK